MQKSEYERILYAKPKINYERLIAKGFRVIRWNQHKNTIEIMGRRGYWAWMADYSESRWSEIVSNEKTLVV